MDLLATLALYLPLPNKHPNDCQLLPSILVANPFRIRDDQVRPRLLPAVTSVLRSPNLVRHAFKIRLHRTGNALANILCQMGLVVLYCEDIVTTSFHDFLSNRRLTADGVNGHQSAVQIQQLQQLGDRRDLIRLVIDGYLAQTQVASRSPSTDQV